MGNAREVNLLQEADDSHHVVNLFMYGAIAVWGYNNLTTLTPSRVGDNIIVWVELLKFVL